MFDYVKADKQKFAVFHTAYTASHIFYRCGWDERVKDAIDCAEDKDAYFVFDDNTLIGGFMLEEDCVSYPFIVAPFDNREMFWGDVLKYAVKTSGKKEIFFDEILEADKTVLIQSYEAKIIWSVKRMIKPTEQCVPVLSDDFYFDSFIRTEIDEITDVIYKAFTSTVAELNVVEIKADVERRLNLLEQTNTLYMSNTVKSKGNNEIVGVCIAGMYPDSENYCIRRFATINELAIKPEYQRRGIGKAMTLKSINDASSISPLMTLGVSIGNHPAELLYENIGFIAGPSYSVVCCTV
ncbi:MAG: GNAT family N-acetyltransferase [Firmicutes bacterium]|nr:GNAT family N-acetyltransferase [Bacillota bacterium]